MCSSPPRPVCRDSNIDLLSLYLGPGHEGDVEDVPCLPECLLVQGVAGVGKSVTLRWFLQDIGIPHAFVHCVEAYQPRLLYQSIMDQLGGGEGKCETVSDFTRMLGECLGGGKRGVIVLESGERLRDESTMLSVFTRLQEITGCNVCTIVETRLDWCRLRPPQDIISPITLHFAQYTREELVKLVGSLLEDDRDEQFRLQYAGLVLSVFYSVTRSMMELLHIARLNYSTYVKPVIAGECKDTDTKKLWFNIEPHLRKCLSTVHLREVASKQMVSLELEQNAVKEETTSTPLAPLPLAAGPTIANVNRITIELPFYSKFILISAFLASYNPAKSDKRFFVKHHGKQRKTLTSMKSKEKLNSQLTGPKPFPLERLLAIFYNIVEEQVNPTANIYSQVTSLVKLQLLSAIGLDMMDQPRYRCNVSLDFVRTVAKTVQFDIYKYLYDHC
eukprot:GFUD01000835.1.p1 GENE.GFUD01000835.1~~GFUD01000835.1.p1  ORF type:complete len:445 (+),score=118.05 GFUD01000835.1:59-1393(+)